MVTCQKLFPTTYKFSWWFSTWLVSMYLQLELPEKSRINDVKCSALCWNKRASYFPLIYNLRRDSGSVQKHGSTRGRPKWIESKKHPYMVAKY